MLRPVAFAVLLGLLICGSAAIAVRGKNESGRFIERKASPSLAAYPFIRGDRNMLHFPGSMERWNALYTRLEEIAFDGRGNVSVVHMGGSHVQAGWLTDKLRRHFNQLNYGLEGERGLVFPYKMAGTNSPHSIECSWKGQWTGCRSSVSSQSCEWGVTGISAITSDTIASVTVAAHDADSLYYSFDRVIVYHQSSPEYCVVPDSRVTIHRIYENLADGYTEFVFSPAMSKFTFHVENKSGIPGHFAFQGLYLGRRGPGITYNAIGVNGAGTYSYLRCEGFAGQLTTLHPDLVLFGIGVNDANVAEADFDRELYEARYDSLIRIFQAVNPNTCFLFITNNDTYFHKRRPNRNALQVQQAMWNLAAKYNGAVFDLFDVMGGLGSIEAWTQSGLAAKDRIHFSRTGYELQADLMFDAFRQSFGDFLEKKGS